LLENKIKQINELIFDLIFIE